MGELTTRAGDRYELLRQLGEGGVGTVYLALDRETGERIALKKLTRMTPVSVLRFKREFRALADVRHPNLIKLYELEHADDGWFLTMELIEGVELMRGLEDAWGNSAANDNASDAEIERARITQIVDAFTQLAHAVRAIHLAGMLHRDLKPSNVLLTPDGRVVVLDFGLVRELGQPMQLVTLQGTSAGTPAYMPPEQARGDEELSTASDWYAFGVMLYEALSGVLPIDGRGALEVLTRKLETDAPPLPSSAGPEGLRQLCAGLLQREAGQRPEAEEILRVLSEQLPLPTRQRSIEPTTFSTDYTSFAPDTQTQQPSTEFVGRESERRQLEAALSECIADRRTIAVHVRGPSGSGKTALLQSFLAEAVPTLIGAEDALVLRSRCYEREAMPFKSIDGVVDALATHLIKLPAIEAASILPRDIAALSALFPALDRVPTLQHLGKLKPRNNTQTDALSLRRRAEQSFRELLCRVAELRSLVIWIDDLHWGDLDSTRVLHDWLKNPFAAPVLIVLSYRREDIGTSPCLTELLSRQSRSEHRCPQRELDLLPLSDMDMHKLCVRRIGASAGNARLATQIVDSSLGNPYLATQLAALARVKLARGDTDLSALSIEELVQHASSMLSAEALQVLRVLSVAGQPLSPRVALQAAGVTRNQRAHVHELQTLRLVRTRYASGVALLEVYHDRVRRSVQLSLTETDRKQIHVALLPAALQEGANPAWLHQLALGAGESGRARHYGILAAEAASKNLAFEQAAELYERCVQLAASDKERAELLKKLALAQVQCRRGNQAADAYLKASKLASGSERIELLKLAASHLLRSGRFDEGELLVHEVLQALQLTAPTSEAGLYAAIGWERARIAVLEAFVTPRSGVVLPPDEMQVGMTYAILALDTQCFKPLRATLFQMRATRMCFQYGERQTTARAYCMNATLATLSADDAAAKQVQKMLARAAALIEPEKDRSIFFELICSRAICAMLLGRLGEVLEPARIAEELHLSPSSTGDLGDYFYMFLVHTARISALQFFGRHGEAAAVARQVLDDAEATSNRCAELQVTMARTYVEQVQTCCRGSRERLDAERDDLPRDELTVLHILHVISVMRVACITGEHAWALPIVSDFELKFKTSPLQRSVFLGYMLRVSQARFLLNCHVASKSEADPESAIAEHVKWLSRKGPVLYRDLAPHRLRARVAILRGDRQRAAQLLEQSLQAHKQAGSMDEMERDRYALGLLAGGEPGLQLIAAATETLRALGVNDPACEIAGYYPELIS